MDHGPRHCRVAPLAAAKLNLGSLILAFLALVFAARAAALDVTAKGAVLMDANTGGFLWSKNQHLQLPPASTAKILTALVILERNRLGEIIVIPSIAATTTGVTLAIQSGE